MNVLNLCLQQNQTLEERVNTRCNLHTSPASDLFLSVNPIPKEEKLNVIIRKHQTKLDLVKYLAACLFSPVKSTLLTAIKKQFLSSFPGLTSNLVKKHLPTLPATVMGHQNQQKQGLQSTSSPNYESQLKSIRQKIKKLKNKYPGTSLDKLVQKDIEDDAFPISPVPNVKTNEVLYALIKEDNIEGAAFDLTGRFPQRSSSGNQYILVGYHFDANYIEGIPLKSRAASVITSAWRELQNKFTLAGVAPKLWILDNETSGELKTAFKQAEVTFQLAPPHQHRTNPAERAIQTWKNHFKAGLATVDPDFPLGEWDRLIAQGNLTLNLLRGARANPKQSAWAYIHGTFNFLATPLAPPGTRTIAHIKPTVRGTWELNGESGWYVGPALDHYRCVTVYFPKTRAT